MHGHVGIKKETQPTIGTVADSLCAVQATVEGVDTGVVVGALGYAGDVLTLGAKHTSRAPRTDENQ